MTPKERELILSVAARLRNANLTEKDPEAERLIKLEVGSHADAVYLLTQAVILQEYGLGQAQQRITGLEKQLQQARQQASNPAPKQASSFLGGMFGGGQAPSSSPTGGKQQAGKPQTSSRPVPGMAGPAGPVPGTAQMAAGTSGRTAAGQAQQPGPAAGGAPAGGGFGGFMRSAAAMAVGVAGGHLLFNGLSNMFGGDEAAAAEADTAAAEGDAAGTDTGEPDQALADDTAPSSEETIADTAGEDTGGGWGMNDEAEAGADSDIDLPPEEPPAEYADAFGNDPFGDEGGVDDAGGFGADPAPMEEDTDFGGGFDDGGDFGGDDDSWG